MVLQDFAPHLLKEQKQNPHLFGLLLTPTHILTNTRTHTYIVHTHTLRKRELHNIIKFLSFGLLWPCSRSCPLLPTRTISQSCPQSLTLSLSFSATFCLPLSLSLLHFTASQSKSYELPTNFMHAVWFLFLLLPLLMLYSLLLLSCTCQEALITVKLKIICKLCPGLCL